MKEIQALTEGRGVNVIVEMLANVNLDTDLGLLAVSGRVVVVGNRGRVEIDARQTMAKESAILGMSLWHLSDQQLSELQDQMAAGFASGALTPVVGSELPMRGGRGAREGVWWLDDWEDCAGSDRMKRKGRASPGLYSITRLPHYAFSPSFFRKPGETKTHQPGRQ